MKSRWISTCCRLPARPKSSWTLLIRIWAAILRWSYRLWCTLTTRVRPDLLFLYLCTSWDVKLCDTPQSYLYVLTNKLIGKWSNSALGVWSSEGHGRKTGTNLYSALHNVQKAISFFNATSTKKQLADTQNIIIIETDGKIKFTQTICSPGKMFYFSSMEITEIGVLWCIFI